MNVGPQKDRETNACVCVCESVGFCTLMALHSFISSSVHHSILHHHTIQSITHQPRVLLLKDKRSRSTDSLCLYDTHTHARGHARKHTHTWWKAITVSFEGILADTVGGLPALHLHPTPPHPSLWNTRTPSSSLLVTNAHTRIHTQFPWWRIGSHAEWVRRPLGHLLCPSFHRSSFRDDKMSPLRLRLPSASRSLCIMHAFRIHKLKFIWLVGVRCRKAQAVFVPKTLPSRFARCNASKLCFNKWNWDLNPSWAGLSCNLASVAISAARSGFEWQLLVMTELLWYGW